jgi:hypothetical protein
MATRSICLLKRAQEVNVKVAVPAISSDAATVSSATQKVAPNGDPGIVAMTKLSLPDRKG